MPTNYWTCIVFAVSQMNRLGIGKCSRQQLRSSECLVYFQLSVVPFSVCVPPVYFSCIVLNCSCTSAYVTYEDICRIGAFQNQTVIAIKAPEETKLEVPTPTEVIQEKCTRHQTSIWNVLVIWTVWIWEWIGFYVFMETSLIVTEIKV